MFNSLIGFLGWGLGVLFVAFCGAIIGKIVTSYQRYLFLRNVRAYVSIWFENFIHDTMECITRLEENKKMFASLSKFEKGEFNRGGAFMYEFDADRILNLNQSDSFNIFVNLSDCKDKTLLNSNYHKILLLLKMIKTFEGNFKSETDEFKKVDVLLSEIDHLYNLLKIEILDSYKRRDDFKDDETIISSMIDLFEILNDHRELKDDKGNSYLKKYKDFAKITYNYIYRKYEILCVFPNMKQIMEISSTLYKEIKKYQHLAIRSSLAHGALISSLEQLAPAVDDKYKVLLKSKVKPFYKVMFNL